MFTASDGMPLRHKSPSNTALTNRFSARIERSNQDDAMLTAIWTFRRVGLRHWCKSENAIKSYTRRFSAPDKRFTGKLERLKIGLFCVEGGVKPQYNQTQSRTIRSLGRDRKQPSPQLVYCVFLHATLHSATHFKFVFVIKLTLLNLTLILT